MPLKYNMPIIGETFTENELRIYSDSENYLIGQIGASENGGMLMTLSEPQTPIGMSFILIDVEAMLFKRVY